MITTIKVDGPNTATMASASTMLGNDAITSKTISTNRSRRGGRYAATTPSSVPTQKAMAIDDSATLIATVVPCTRRE